MRHRPVLLALVVLLSPMMAAAAPPDVTRFTLENGVHVLVLNFKGSEHCAIFSLLPLGLLSDGPDCTQWSHLIEHLTLRAIGPIQDYRARNAETLGGGMHLDWMGTGARWTEGLEVQMKWLNNLPFEERILREEVPKALGEIDSTVPRGYTHKWALAAWNQAVRHKRERVYLRCHPGERRGRENLPRPSKLRQCPPQPLQVIRFMPA